MISEIVERAVSVESEREKREGSESTASHESREGVAIQKSQQEERLAAPSTDRLQHNNVCENFSQ